MKSVQESLDSGLESIEDEGVSTTTAKTKASLSLALVMGSGIHGLGIGLTQRPDLLETTFFDLFDVRHQLWVHFGGAEEKRWTRKIPYRVLLAY